ncbi:hypothetical protein JI75_05670 [Berryella intestinalis]|uniref:Uncharacterized protein n=1 Tax=Berryella intestinalis TaxID=1531429 RepID=A0A0A8B490_9ACTN|nr:class I SAM-dependent methyltransferase [Berryella intestinalis]AJC12225.1 hypothetical protein JI75_05670 [Berryella intestinalis]
MGELKGVADTLYIPLTARIQASKRFPEFFYDETALSLECDLPESSIEKNSNEYSYIASACRYRVTDSITLDFMSHHENCNVVNLGAGLETSFFRLKPKTAKFYEMDLPDVVKMRKDILGERDNDVLIGGDLFDLSWANEVDASLPTLLTSLGVFQYFDEKRIRAFISDARKIFDRAELVFDAMNEKAISYANKYVRKTGNKNAEMRFWVNDPSAFAKESGIRLIAQEPFFTDARKQLKGRLALFTRAAMREFDEGSRRGYVLHYDLGKR